MRTRFIEHRMLTALLALLAGIGILTGLTPAYAAERPTDKAVNALISADLIRQGVLPENPSSDQLSEWQFELVEIPGLWEELGALLFRSPRRGGEMFGDLGSDPYGSIFDPNYLYHDGAVQLFIGARYPGVVQDGAYYFISSTAGFTSGVRFTAVNKVQLVDGRLEVPPPNQRLSVDSNLVLTKGPNGEMWVIIPTRDPETPVGILIDDPENGLRVVDRAGQPIFPRPDLGGSLTYLFLQSQWFEPYQLGSLLLEGGSTYVFRGSDGNWEPLTGVDRLNRMLLLRVGNEKKASGLVTELTFRVLLTEALVGAGSVNLDAPSNVMFSGGTRRGPNYWSRQAPNLRERLETYEVAPEGKFEPQSNLWSLDYNIFTQSGAIVRLGAQGRIAPLQVDSYKLDTLVPAGLFQPLSGGE